MAQAAGATTVNFEDESVVERLNDLTGGKGPEKCIDAVGLEAHATATLDSLYDRAKQAMMLETDRAHVLREMIYVCRPAGTLSIPGVYGGLVDKIPIGALMNKGLTVRTGQTHVNRWTDDLLRRILEGQIDPSFVITHTEPLETGPRCTRRSATSRTAASRSCCDPDRCPMPSLIPQTALRGRSQSAHDRLAKGLGWLSHRARGDRAAGPAGAVPGHRDGGS